MPENQIEHEEYIYAKQRNIMSKFYWRCELQDSPSCKGRAITSLEDTIQFLINIKPHSHSPEPFKFMICKVINKIKNTATSSSDKHMQIFQNNIVNLPAESIPHFPSKNTIRKRSSLMRSSLNVQEPRELHQINFPEHLRSTISNH
ncbi:hypothetical protein HZS_6642 [Henneguya salminicola]|nr:hypothetical protein HZS_6642 [Henneguya salminicola]